MAAQHVGISGQQVIPQSKKLFKAKKKRNVKVNGFILFANAQRSRLSSQYEIKGLK